MILLYALNVGRMDREAIENNHTVYLERLAFYKQNGMDTTHDREMLFNAMGLSSEGERTILEVGTGKGYFTLVLARKGFSICSLDDSPEEQYIARLNLAYDGLRASVNFVIGNAECLNFRPESFDAVISCNTFHHLSHPVKAAEEALRVTKRGGRVMIADFSDVGFATIAAIHASEGKQHEMPAIRLHHIRDVFSAQGYRVSLSILGNEELLIIRQ